MDGIIKHQQNGTLTIRTEIDFELCKVLLHVQQLTAFEIPKEMIEDWSKSLKKLIPDLDYNALQFLIDQMKLGNIEYDKALGIQNLTNGLRFVRKTETGYKLVKTNIPW